MNGAALRGRVTMMGSGTSSGVPVINCRCPVCTSDHPRNRRTRAGLKLELPEGTLLVDTPTELRLQCLEFGLERVDGVLFTHAHADHIFGLDDLRIFNFRQRQDIPCYGSRATLEALARTFAYVFEDGQRGGGKPRLELVPIDGLFEAAGVEILPVPVLHGELEITAFRIGDFAYVTDCSEIPPTSRDLLAGVDVLILGALRYHRHPTHFTLVEAIEAARDLGARRTIFTHLAHEVDYTRPEIALPAGMELGYDGLVLELG